MNPESLPQTYFSLFQQQLDACKVSDPAQHAELRKKINREIRDCLAALKQHQDTNNPEIWYALGHASMYYEKDSCQATAWYQRAADAGHTKSITKIGNRLRQTRTPDQQQQGISWLNKACEQGDPHAMQSMGIAYRDGQGVDQDFHQAKQWLERAKESGDPAATELLADLHLNYCQSPADALPYYLEAQEQGGYHHQALARIYNSRGSSAYDPLKAKEHFEILLKKAQKSAPWVMLELAKLHASGQVSENGITHAKKWLYQIFSQCPKSSPIRKKAERLLSSLDDSLF